MVLNLGNETAEDPIHRAVCVVCGIRTEGFFEKETLVALARSAGWYLSATGGKDLCPTCKAETPGAHDDVAHLIKDVRLVPELAHLAKPTEGQAATDPYRKPHGGIIPRFSFAAPPQLITSETRREYMWRWKVASWLGFELKFHMFRASDPDDLHDHPWWFLSLLLAGSYDEVVEGPDGEHTTIHRKAPSLAYRRAEHRHAVKVPNGPALTLVLSGRRSRDWGFWPACEGIGKQFVYWKNYLGGHRC